MKATVEQIVNLGEFTLKHLSEQGKHRFMLFPNKKRYVPEGLIINLKDPSTGEVVTTTECEGQDILLIQTKPIKVPERTEVVVEILGQELHFYID